MTLRERVYLKYNGRCAYCGEELTLKSMHIDHLKPIFRNWGTNHPVPKHAGEDIEENMMPACKPCNLRKSTLSLESFRSEIALQVDRLRRDSSAFRLAERFGTIQETNQPVVFYFER